MSEIFVSNVEIISPDKGSNVYASPGIFILENNYEESILITDFISDVNPADVFPGAVRLSRYNKNIVIKLDTFLNNNLNSLTPSFRSVNPIPTVFRPPNTAPNPLLLSFTSVVNGNLTASNLEINDNGTVRIYAGLSGSSTNFTTTANNQGWVTYACAYNTL